MFAAMDELEQQYRTLVDRISGYPMTEAARTRILAEIEEIYRREKAAESGPRQQDPRRTLRLSGVTAPNSASQTPSS
jgi:hypothetical protein